MAKIESILRRKGGTKVTIEDTEYHFKHEGDDENGRHVAEVSNPAHAKRLLNIPEGYRKFNAKDAPPAEMTAEDKAAATERNTLTEQFRAKFNRDPDPDMSTEDMRAAIDDGTGA